MTIKANKSLGQNFINDTNLLKKIVKCAGIIEGHNILEIGPGTGNLTKAILALHPIHLIAIEKDVRCLSLLQQLAEENNNFSFLTTDALHVDERDLISKPVKLISNLPYNISTILLIKWLNYIDFFESLTLMFQKEVAERLIAKKNTKAYSKLSVLVQARCKVQHNFDIPPSCFVPRPKVTSSVVTLTPYEASIPFNYNRLKVILQVVFSQRRKTLNNSLKILYADPYSILASVNINSALRPEDLSLEDYFRLSNVL